MQPATPEDPGEPSGTVVNEAVLAQRRERRAEQDQGPLMERAAGAERAVAALELRAQELRAELDRATAERNDAVRRVGESEATLRTARQHGFAEEQQRIDAEADLAGARREAEGLRAALDGSRARVAELERELRSTRAQLEGELAAVQELADGLTERLQAEGLAREAALSSGAGTPGVVGGEPALSSGATARDAAARKDAELVRAYAPEPAGDGAGYADLAARVAAAQRRADATASALGAARERGLRDAEERAAARRAISALQDSVAALREEGELLRARATAELGVVTRERDVLTVQVQDIETTVRQLGERFDATRSALLAQVSQERAAREAAEVALERERSQVAAEIAGERDALGTRVAAMLRDLDQGLARVRAGRRGADVAAAPPASASAESAPTPPPHGVPAPGPPAPVAVLPADLRGELERLNAALEAMAPPEGTEDVVAGLAQAAERLRAQAAEAPAAEGLPAVRTAQVAVAAPATAPVESAVVAPRRAGQAWLATVIERLAVTDLTAAAELVIALVPVQGRLLGHARYDLAVSGAAPVRVTVEGARVDVRRLEAADAPGAADFRVTGSPAVLAPLVAGGVRRPVRVPPGVRVEGRRRRLRRVLRSMRRPVRVDDLRAPGVAIDPGLILGALTAAIDPDWVRGHRFAVAFVLTDVQRAWCVAVADGSSQITEGDRPIDGEPAATVRGSVDGVLALVAGDLTGPATPAKIEGSQPAVLFLLAWWDRAQGLPMRTA